MSKKQQNTGAFKKDLRKFDIWALALGAIIGWGCFVMPGTAFLPKAGTSSIIGLLLGAVVMAIISFSYGYCIRKFPLSGGEFIYADASFGKVHAFACGWMLILGYWSLIPLNSTAIGLITRYLFPGIFQFGHLYTIAGWDVYLGEVLLSTCFIVVLGVMNVRGVKSAGWFQTIVAVSLFGSVMICLIGTLIRVPFSEIKANLSPFFAELTTNSEGLFDGVTSKGGIACIIAVACYAPYCFVGFDCIPQAAEEYKFSHKAALGLMIAAILIGGVIYAAVVFVAAAGSSFAYEGLTWSEMMMQNPGWAAGESVKAVLGYPGLFFLGVAMLCAVLSGMNAFYLAASRLMYSMSYADALPETFGELHPKYGTPDKATYFLMGLAVICPWFGRTVLGWVVDMTCVGAAFGFTYTCATATKMAKKEGLGFQTGISAVGTVLAAFFIILSFIPGSPGFLSVPSFIMLGVWVVMGVIFWMMRKNDFLHGRWEGVDVEHILMTRMTEDGTIGSYNKNQ